LSVTWNGSTANFDTSGLASGNFTIVITDGIGCTDSIGPIVIMDEGVPVADFTASPMVTDVNSPLITFTDASSSDVTSWNWIFDSLGTASAQDTTFSFNNAGIYDVTLIVMNALGCSDTVSYSIIVNDVDSLSIPNIITPDGNGINDIFVITGLPAGSYVAIYNRWGQKLYETKNYLNNWDGYTSAGDRVVSGTYYYVIQDPNGNKYSGYLTVSGE
ncbi:MAG: gliding motility-associated C-terminal domain-containing protein, partial [Flavobacteriales bacterium]|nr:gliding motility-associated C-terminal domain-containing protein [Flavobacteriales bacterium]